MYFCQTRKVWNMKMRIVILALLSCCIFKTGFAGPGDTTWVQTFTFNWSKPSGMEPKKGRFVFPSFVGKRFEKILMYYTLKCDPSQNPQCGEWDYLTYTHLFEPTGKMDSAKYTQAKYVYYNYSSASVDTFIYRTTPSWKYNPYFQPFIIHDITNSFDSITIGNISTSTNYSLFQGNPDGRMQFLYKASELISNGLSSGTINGLQLYVGNIISPVTIQNLKIRLKQTNLDTINIQQSLSNLTNVFGQNIKIQNNGWIKLDFTQNFQWDGVSNIIVDISFSGSNGDPQIACNSNTTNSINSLNADNYIGFGLNNFVEIPVQRFIDADSSITIMFWSYGDNVLQPFNGSVFEGINTAKQRLLNTHIPWGNSRIYWDAGKNSYDRIDKATSSNEFKGQWNHWAFTKNCQTGSMKIYCNGSLWHSGNGKIKPMDTIAQFILGKAITYQDGVYKGFIDDFSIWSKELSQANINQSLNASISTFHPDYQSLLYSYDFDEGASNILHDLSGIAMRNAKLKGIQNWQSFKGERFKNFTNANYRPVMVFERGNYLSHLDSTLTIDSVPNLPVMAVVYGNPAMPTQATDTIFIWTPYYRYIFDNYGNKTDSVFVTGNDTLFQQNYIYYGTPFEIINKWELGRFITPYGNGLSLGNGWTWIYDVSDFVHLLKDTLTIHAGNFQELLDLKFAFIEGVPSRDVLSLQNVWQGNFSLSTFDNNVVAKTYVIDTASKMIKLRTTLTGHGMGSTHNCAEFCPNMHKLKVNGSLAREWQILQSCASNPLYPQGGTWLYDRAAWCPGMKATMQEFELDTAIHNQQLTIDYDIDYDPDGNYVTESQLVTYTAPNFQTDAALAEIIAPNKYEMHTRFNPICGKPIIKIKNNGSNPLSSLQIEYGFANGIIYNWQWNGLLKYLETSEIELPTPDWSAVTDNSSSFWAKVKNPNNSTDQYPYNDRLEVQFNVVNVYTYNNLQFYFATNHAPDETTWKLMDQNGAIIAENDTSMTANTIYTRQVQLADGCYKLTISDSGDDGLKFWNNMPPYGNGTAGMAVLKRSFGTSYVPLYTFQADFGREISHSFIINTSAGIEHKIRQNFSLYPNPATDVVTISSYNILQDKLNIQVIDLIGKVVFSNEVNMNENGQYVVNIKSLKPGSYWIITYNNDTILSRNKLVKM